MKPQVNDRIRLRSPLVNPDSEEIPVEDVPVGTEGTVDWIGQCAGQVCGVKFDNGVRLVLLEDDDFEVIGSGSD
jgi:hypothetical protein